MQFRAWGLVGVLSAAALLAGCGKPDEAPSVGEYQIGDRLKGSAPAEDRATGDFREIGWDDLLPPDWNPAKVFEGLDLATLDDEDPRAIEAIEEMKRAWAEAPTNPALEGVRVKIPGFIVPLEWGRDMSTEFIMVPYFGACIHTPPPPANQILHVFPDPPARGLRNMDTVWVSGILEAVRADTPMGHSGYRMRALKVEPYAEPRS
ncbi:MAG: DUF3299 domain-containing protein [Thiotrichales bacterium]